jgi:hypothetical protein
MIPEEDRELRRDINRRQAVAMAATFHMPEMLAGRGAPRHEDVEP